MTLANTSVVPFPARAGVGYVVYFLGIETHVVAIIATLDATNSGTFDDTVGTTVWRDIADG